MTRAANTPSVQRIGPLCVALGVTLSLLLAGLLAFTGAPARADTGGEGPPSAEQLLPSGETPPPAEETPAAETPTAQVLEAEEAPAPAEETPPQVAEAPPVEPPAPPEVEAPAPPEVEAPAPVEEAPAPVEEAPEVEVPAPVEEPVEVPEHEEKVGKAPLEAAGEETTIISSQSSTGSSSNPAVSLSEPEDAPEVEASLWPSALPITTLPPARSQHQAPPACGLEASIATSCAVGWLSLSTQSTSPNTVLIASGSLASQITGTETEDASHRRTSIENTPSTPTPAQGPGGSGGVSAAGGGSGAACSAFASAAIKLCHAEIYTLAVILDQPSWRTSFFVLVPERPG